MIYMNHVNQNSKTNTNIHTNTQFIIWTKIMQTVILNRFLKHFSYLMKNVSYAADADTVQMHYEYLVEKLEKSSYSP